MTLRGVVLYLSVALLAAPEVVSANRAVDARDVGTPKVVEIRIQHIDEKPITNRALRAAMKTQQEQPFAHRFFRADLTTIENLYRSRGYMDVDIVRRRLELDDTGKLRITLKIDSGRQWTVSDVNLLFDGQDSLLVTILRSRLHAAAGDVFRYGDVIEDERHLLTWLNGEGFAHARVHNRVELSSRQRQAAVSYDISTGRRMYFGPVTIEATDLHTSRSLIERQLAFREGQLYDPEKLRSTRNNLSRIGMFRSVTLTTPSVAKGDSVQPVTLNLQERKFVHLRGRLFVNNTEPGVSGRVQHANFLGRGNRIGADASLGQPLQGFTLFLTERNFLSSTGDLTLSAGATDEWGNTRVFADPTAPGQFDLLTANYSIANELNFLLGTEEAAAFLSNAVYDYPSIEQLWKVNAVLSRSWELDDDVVYASNFTVNWTQSRNRPSRGRTIDFDTGDIDTTGVGDGDDGGGFGDDPFGDDPFGDDGALPDDPFGGEPAGRAAQDGLFPYDPAEGSKGKGRIQIDDAWIDLLTNEAQTLNFQLDFHRDTRDNQIAPTRGTFLRVAALYAVELGRSQTRVFDGDVEARNYLRIGERLVWAHALRGVMTGSLRRESDLPQPYWKEFGGEGSVRGVGRDDITAIGGGRGGLVLRNELRVGAEPGGIVLFWDRAGVWRRVRQASWRNMVSGYGAGLRWDVGIPLRLDLGWSDRPDKPRDWIRPEVYVSIGQAF